LGNRVAGNVRWVDGGVRCESFSGGFQPVFEAPSPEGKEASKRATAREAKLSFLPTQKLAITSNAIGSNYRATRAGRRLQKHRSRRPAAASHCSR